MRIDPTVFSQHDFRVHTFLADVPLHDVWTFTLAGGGEGRIIRNVAVLLLDDAMEQVNPLVRGLFRLRCGLGRMFRWDDAQYAVSDASYVHRLTSSDRARSLDEPESAGRVSGGLYLSPRDARRTPKCNRACFFGHGDDASVARLPRFLGHLCQTCELADPLVHGPDRPVSSFPRVSGVDQTATAGLADGISLMNETYVGGLEDQATDKT